MEALGLHVFASKVAVSHAYVHLIEMGTPVEIAGLEIHPGDLLHGDCHGILSIPQEHAVEIPRVAAGMIEREKKLIALCQKQDVAIDELRSAIQDLRGETS